MLQFDGYVRFSYDRDDDGSFTIGNWYKVTNSGIIDDDGYEWGRSSYIVDLLNIYQDPLVAINEYMGGDYGYGFDSYLPTKDYNEQILGVFTGYIDSPENSETTESGDKQITTAKATYYQLQSILNALEASNPLMDDKQLIDRTDWVVESVIDKIISLMGYPKSDFVFGVILDAIRDMESFTVIRNQIEGGC